MKILFICRGNVGRSQMAEAIFNKLAQGKHVAYSAGTRVIDKEGNSRDGEKLKDRPAAKEVIVSLLELGIDANEFVRDQLKPETLNGMDKVIVMAEEHTIPDYLKEYKGAEYWEIADPKGQTQQDTNDIRDLIAEKVRTLLSSLDA